MASGTSRAARLAWRAGASMAGAALVVGALAAPAGAWRRVDGMKVRRSVAALVPGDGALLGAWTKPRTGWAADDYKAAWHDLERDLGRTLDIQQHYYTFAEPFPSWREPYDLAHGRIPLVSWRGIRSTRIANGSVDATIRARARGVAALGDPIFLRYSAEMDGTRNEGWIQGPDNFVRAWRHIHNVFDAEGATNAVWVWCPNASGFTWGDAREYYPGGRYVDWICADGYNWAPGEAGAQWRSFGDIFEDWYRFGVAKDRPLMIGETGAQEGAPGAKAAWIDQARQQMKQRFPAIRAFVYFNADNDYPWWIDSSASSLEAFRRLAQDPYFRTR
jgi:Glycosyl hydrolase family 26